MAAFGNNVSSFGFMSSLARDDINQIPTKPDCSCWAGSFFRGHSLSPAYQPSVSSPKCHSEESTQISVTIHINEHLYSPILFKFHIAVKFRNLIRSSRRAVCAQLVKSDAMPKGTHIMQALLSKGIARLTPNASSANLASPTGFTKAPVPTTLFPSVDPSIDGDDCDHDCASCTVHYPAKFSIDEDDKLYGHVKGWSTHLVVATGKSDWVRDVADEKGSVMEAVGRYGTDKLANGKVMLSASNIPTPDGECHGPGGHDKTRVLLLPAWKIIDDVTPGSVKSLMEGVIAHSSTNMSPLGGFLGHANGRVENSKPVEANGEDDVHDDALQMADEVDADPPRIPASLASKFNISACPHRAIILMCSQKTRDARCGQSAPLLRKEFERILRPMGLFRDLHDERPGGVGIYFISHVGGHKYSANIMVYRREGRKREGTDESIDGAPLSSEAVQCIWLARVRPEECENIIKYTVLQGKVVKPHAQLRGGFDRENKLVSW